MSKVISMGEIMMRLTPPVYQKIVQTSEFSMTYGGGEANVVISLAHFGHDTVFITKLPKNQLGDGAIRYLKGNNINTKYIVRDGDNLGIYFLETGFGGRGSQVIYNRKHSAFNTVNEDDFDFDEIFDGASWFHVSGITLALSENVREAAYLAIKKAKEHGVTVSFDFNFRSKLWTIEESKDVYEKILPYVDICFASLFDATDVLQLTSELDTTDPNYERDVFIKMINKFKLVALIGTKREVYSANDNSLKAFYHTKDEYCSTEPIRFNIVDRIGGGDAFASGIIHGFLTETMKPREILEFGLGASILKHTIQGDASLLEEEDVFNFIKYNGSGKVNR